MNSNPFFRAIQVIYHWDPPEMKFPGPCHVFFPFLLSAFQSPAQVSMVKPTLGVPDGP